MSTLTHACVQVYYVCMHVCMYVYVDVHLVDVYIGIYAYIKYALVHMHTVLNHTFYSTYK